MVWQHPLFLIGFLAESIQRPGSSIVLELRRPAPVVKQIVSSRNFCESFQIFGAYLRIFPSVALYSRTIELNVSARLGLFP